MPTEVSESSSPAETSPESAEVQHDNTPINTVGDALKAFQSERERAALQQFPSKVPTPKPSTPNPRDYSGLEPEEVAYFKQMGNSAFNALKPKYLEWKQLRGEVENLRKSSAETTKHSFFEHEEAYQLTPEFRSISSNLNQIQAETSHWQKQLANIRAGQPWHPIVLNEKGEPVIGEAQEAGPEGESVVLNALMQAHSIRSDLSNKLGNIQSSFTNQHKSFISNLTKIEKDIFQGADEKALSDAMNSKLPMFPQYMHGNPLVRSLAKSLAVIDGLISMLNEAKSSKATASIKAATAASAGPKGSDTMSVGVKPGETVGNVWDEFKKARVTGLA